MSSPSQLEQVISLDLCPELSVEQQQQQSALNATRQRWPYSQPVVCCALIDRPFELMTEGECIAIRASKFEWPLWEGENGCVRPPSEQSPDTPVCCFFTDRRYLRSVTQESYSECVSSGDEVLNAVPLTWCGPLFVCISVPHDLMSSLRRKMYNLHHMSQQYSKQELLQGLSRITRFR